MISSPLTYLKLRAESGSRLFWQDVVPIFICAAMLTAPFIFTCGSNFFHKDGFLDKFGTFSSVLTGFYIAGLLAVATMSGKDKSLDDEIEVGRISLLTAEGEEYLTRRQYVCYMFGYLAFLSLAITLLSIMIVIISPNVKLSGLSFSIRRFDIFVSPSALRAAIIFSLSCLFASLALTTLRGLYYLVDRLYAEKATIVDPAAGE